MKIEYKLYKRHHDNKFIGWEVGYEKYRGKKGKVIVTGLVPVAMFYGRKAKDNAKFFKIHLTEMEL